MFKLWHVVLLSFLIALFWVTLGRTAGLLPPFQDLTEVPIIRTELDPAYKIDFDHPQLFITGNTLMYSFGAFHPGEINVAAGCLALKTFIDLYKTQSKLFVKDGINNVAVVWRVLVGGEQGEEDSEYILVVFGYVFSHNQGRFVLMHASKDDTLLAPPLISVYDTALPGIVGACTTHIQQLRGVKSTSLF
jgi:hypothetical protein